jgi:hypothetical protein
MINFISNFFKSKKQAVLDGLQKIHAIFDELEREALANNDSIRYYCTLAVKKGVMSGLDGILDNASILSKNWADDFSKEFFNRRIDNHCFTQNLILEVHKR